ncbi:efflux RND transporter permease subunit [Magnetospirillum sulfuroxidans]|uniref:Efflux RND transporter permease subunit n=1 Tax=Magnetospirillum sulfuroxidans TaxID=611300 RepID=A0ABS5IBC4_9PROT|nr:efflux RND transporter permease subunit [Magnetospirillum sulfuroxidans]MBR9971614.1 efflux RND transporter permease subunit [Magnetospirillum sulfuroxidans]
MFDIFIKRPVLASVISLLILFIGLRALMMLPVRQYPEMKNTVITITTTYPGADAELIQGFITQPLQKAVATSAGLDYITSQSVQSASVIKAYVRLNEDPDAAMTEVMSKVNEVRSVLPRGINDPVLKKETGQTFASAYLAFSSAVLTQEQITDYVNRVIQPKLASVPGVANPEVFGGQNFSIRVWLDPEKLAQLDLTAADVNTALTANNFTAAAGSTKGAYDVVTTQARTDLNTIADFRNLVVRHDGTRLIRLSDIAEVSLGAQNDEMAVFASGKRAIFVGIFTTPEANPLTVVQEIRDTALPAIIAQLPPGLDAEIAYDSTVFIQAAIDEVVKTILEAAVIVMIVIFAFMGSFRSVAIPVITVPLSLIGVGVLLLALGFSINLLTLLAMVLAIGLVVDDAIVVVENVHRHIEEGLSPFQAAIVGTREIAGPVISMTITLAAVYAPIAFMGGLTGSLFKEFALALAGSVIVSGLIALTLSPMMCSLILKHDEDKKGLPARIDAIFDGLQGRYRRALAASLTDRSTTLVFAAIVVVVLPFLFLAVPTELAPEEDQGVVFTAFTGPASANTEYMEVFAHQIDDALKEFPEVRDRFLIAGIGSINQGFGGAVTKPWGERKLSTKELTPLFQKRLDAISGVRASVFSPSPLPGSDGLPVEFVITSTSDYKALNDLQAEMMRRATASGQFAFIDSDLKFESPQTVVDIDRDKAGSYGVTMQQIGEALATMTGGNYVNLVNLQGRSYQVIPQVPRDFRLNPRQLGRFHVRTGDGGSVPLSSLVTLKQAIKPVSLNQFNQLNSFTITAFPMPGITLGQALSTLDGIAAEVLPQGTTFDYGGQSRQYMQEGNSLAITFVFALLIIFLVLAAQFESFRDPLVILVSVPLSLCGALIPLALGVATMNIYTQVGLITLVGLITKHGILICEVARERQEQEGLSRMEAVQVAASLRLRPILMTTAAMVAGLIPLLMASGAGAASRFSIAVVIVAGMSIGTLFTLFVLPVIYTFLATDRGRKVEPETLHHTATEGAE